MKRCLFVDESSIVRRVAKHILSDADLLVIEAATGAEAIDVCLGEMPEIVIVDAALADMDALEFIRRIRTLAPEQRPRIAISLIEADLGAIMRAKRAGAHGHILKPFNRAQLLESLRSLTEMA